jgi:hypothetical protein
MVDTPHPQYAVIHQTVSMEPDGRGNYVKTHTVHYRTASGVESHVKLPHHEFTARNVHDQIAHEATRIDQVNNLGQGPPPEHEA